MSISRLSARRPQPFNLLCSKIFTKMSFFSLEHEVCVLIRIGFRQKWVTSAWVANEFSFLFPYGSFLFSRFFVFQKFAFYWFHKVFKLTKWVLDFMFIFWTLLCLTGYLKIKVILCYMYVCMYIILLIYYLSICNVSILLHILYKI